MHGVRQVLRHAAVAPPESLRVGVVAFEWLWSALLAEVPFTSVLLRDRDNVAAPAVTVGVLFASPAADVMRTGCHAGANGLRDPEPVDEVADLGFDADQVAWLEAEAGHVGGMHPERVAVRDFVEPLGCAAAAMDKRRQTECG
jgi:hypothetical protein